MQKFNEIKKKLEQHASRWLITGAAGFIGSHLLEFLLQHKQKVVGLDNFSTGHQKNLAEVLEKYPAADFTFIKGDIRNLEDCQQAAQGVDYILHQAALGSVPRSIENPMLTHEVNLTGFLNVLIAAKGAKVKRLVYASSSSVYGDSPTLPKVETHQGNLLSPYAVTKMANELYAQAFATCYGLESIGLRYFNVFGARQDPEGAYAAVIPLWVKALIKNEPVYIYGDGETSRDFCYVGNVVQANILSALTTHENAVNIAYNVAVGDRTTLLELYQELKKLMGNETHEPTYRAFRAGDIRHSLADVSRAKTLLGYNATHNLRQGLEEAIGWYQKNVG